jgi:hypothetical protein
MPAIALILTKVIITVNFVEQARIEDFFSTRGEGGVYDSVKKIPPYTFSSPQLII